MLSAPCNGRITSSMAGEANAEESHHRCLAISDCDHERLSRSGRLALSDPGGFLAASGCQRIDCLPKLERGSGAAQRLALGHVGCSRADWLYVVRGHVVEAAAAGLRWIAIL